MVQDQKVNHDMFRSTLIVGLLMLLQSALAQNPIPAEPVLVEVERSRDWRLEQFISSELDENGTLVSVTNSWTSLASGMHYFDGKEWVRTIAAFEETPEMFIAQYGPHKVILNRLLGTPDAVDLLTDDGTRLRSAPRLLAYRNRVTGESVLLGEVRAEVKGELVEPNTVLWREAFDTVPGASVRAVYTAGGFEMDVVLGEPLPDPGQLGLTDADQVDLEVLTAFQEGPAPVKFPYTVADGLLDERLDFGSMTMSGGLAFTIEQADKLHPATAPVRKTFQRIEGGDWLIESVPYPSVRTLLENLPANKEGAQIERKKLPGKTNARSVVANRRAIVVQAGMAHASVKRQAEPWTQRLARGAAAVKAQGGERRSASFKGTQGLSTLALKSPLAKLRNTEAGVVIDYTIVNAISNYPFKSDTTYLVLGVVNLTGTPRFEGGTVIKYAWATYPNYPSLKLLAGTTLDWQASPYLPIVFTAKDDNSVGEIIDGNTYTPPDDVWYAWEVLNLAGTTVAGNRLHNFRIAHANTGLQFQSQNNIEISNAQFVNSLTGIQAYNGGPLRNVLFHHVRYPVWNSGGFQVNGEHLTIDTATTFPFVTNAYLINSLMVNVTNLNSTGIANTIRSNTTTTFSTNGAGHHYLADPALRGTGSTGINTDLAAELKLMTTAAPVNLTNHFTTATILSPVVPRNTGVPDIGYHYWPIDWTWSGLNVGGATLVLTNGVVVANYGTNGTTLTTGGKVVSLGGPKAMNRIISYQLVQERPFVWGPTGSYNAIFNSPSASATEIDLRFTDVLLPANTVAKRALNRNLSWAGPIRLMDSRLRNISQTLYGTNVTQTALLALTNNIFERCNFTIGQGYGIYAYALELYAWNNLFLGGDLTLTYLWAWYPWAIRDNVFANLTPYVLGTPPADNNGYTATYAPLGGMNNKTSLVLDWQSGPLGPYYYPTNGVNAGLTNLLNSGSRLSANASLYHHTTAVNQTKETNSTVDIGFHYVALNNSNVPVDSDNDGLADWFEDRNGNNAKEAYESALNDVDSDWDGRSDWEEVMLDNTLSTTHTSRGQGRQFWVRFNSGVNGEQGEIPTVNTNVVLADNWNGKGAKFTSTNSQLTYNIVEPNGTVNLPTTAAVGGVTIRFWFRPDWVPYPCTGTNPRNYQSLTDKLRLFEIGCWRVSLSPWGTNFIFETRTGGVWATNLNYALPSFEPGGCGTMPANRAWEFMLTFNDAASYLYVDGALVTLVNGQPAGLGTSAYPTWAERAEGFTIGNARGGGFPAMGIIDEFEVFTGLLTEAYGQTLATRREHLITRLTNDTVYLDWTQAWGGTDIKRKVVSTGMETPLVSGVQNHQYTDTGLVDGTLYQYEVGVRKAYVGRNLPATIYRGRLLLLIDETLTSVLANEIETLRLDLLGDGWQVVTNPVPRMNDDAWASGEINHQYTTDVQVVKGIIKSDYNTYSNVLKGVILLGHVTVPYSGLNQFPEDGHGDNPGSDPLYHRGAWTADSYYGDMDGNWSDTGQWYVPSTGTNTSVNYRKPYLNNVPGDGKWDDFSLPLSGASKRNLELFVGRIDFARMPAWIATFPGSTNVEVDLVKRYIAKDHVYRLKQNAYNLDTSFSALNNSFVANVGAAVQINSRFSGSDALDSYQRASTELSSSVTFASMGGYGSEESVTGWRGDTISGSIFRSREIPAPFYIWRGSVFGDWNLKQDNFLKASLTAPNHGLVAVWLQQNNGSGDPITYWKFGRLGLAGTIGEALLETVDGSFLFTSTRTSYIYGDPTIRMLQIAPPSNLSHTTNGTSVTLSWSPSLETVTGYLVLSSPNLNTPFTNLLATTTSTAYTTNSGGSGKWYQVRAAGMSSTSGTTVNNLSLGVIRHVP